MGSLCAPTGLEWGFDELRHTGGNWQIRQDRSHIACSMAEQLIDQVQISFGSPTSIITAKRSRSSEANTMTQINWYLLSRLQSITDIGSSRNASDHICLEKLPHNASSNSLIGALEMLELTPPCQVLLVGNLVETASLNGMWPTHGLHVIMLGVIDTICQAL